MFKRIVKVNFGDGSMESTEEFNSLEAMRLTLDASISGVSFDPKLKWFVEEFEDDNLLRSYEFTNSAGFIEYSDPAQSAEGGSVMSKSQLHKYGINIILNTREHGQMNRDRRLSDGESPAHANIFVAFTTNKIGELNITGKCPTNINEVVEYRPEKNRNRQLFNSSRKIIIKWANDKTKIINIRTNKEEEIANWVAMQIFWETEVDTDLNKMRKEK
jgi:hypothetical protein